MDVIRYGRYVRDFFEAIALNVADGYERNENFKESNFHASLVGDGFKHINSSKARYGDRVANLANMLSRGEVKISFNVKEFTQRAEVSVGADIAFIVTIICGSETLSKRGFLVQLKSGKVGDKLKFHVRYKAEKRENGVVVQEVDQAELMLRHTQHAVFFVSVPIHENTENDLRSFAGDSCSLRERYGARAVQLPLHQNAPSQSLGNGNFLNNIIGFPFIGGAFPGKYMHRFWREYCHFLEMRYDFDEKEVRNIMNNERLRLQAENAIIQYDRFRREMDFQSNSIIGLRTLNSILVIHAESVLALSPDKQSFSDLQASAVSFPEFFLRAVLAREFGDTNECFINALEDQAAPLATTVIHANISLPQLVFRDDLG